MTETLTELVPLAVLGPEVGQTVDDLALVLGSDVRRDDIGLRCVPANVARGVIDDHRTRVEEDRARQERNRQLVAAAVAKAQPVPAGVPAVDGLDAHASQLAADERDRGNLWLDGGADQGGTFEGIRADR